MEFATLMRQCFFTFGFAGHSASLSFAANTLVSFFLSKRNGGIQMAKINLRNYYPIYHQDCFVDVTDELAELLLAFERAEEAGVPHKAVVEVYLNECQ